MTVDKVAQDVVVSFNYRLSLEDGSLVEESEAGEPLVYLHGHDNIIPGLESALAGMKIGEKKSVVVAAEDAYGEYDPDALETIDREDLPPQLKPEVGMLLTMEDDEGNAFMAQVVDVDDDFITVDFNHPMAGEELHFDVTIVDLRPATKEEMTHGHAHGEGGHHH